MVRGGERRRLVDEILRFAPAAQTAEIEPRTLGASAFRLLGSRTKLARNRGIIFCGLCRHRRLAESVEIVV